VIDFQDRTTKGGGLETFLKRKSTIPTALEPIWRWHAAWRWARGRAPPRHCSHYFPLLDYSQS